MIKSNRWTLPLLISVFVLPWLIAWSLYQGHYTGKTRNHGELLTPPQTFQHFIQKNTLSQAVGKKPQPWTVVYRSHQIDPNTLHAMHQFQLALGKLAPKVRFLIVSEHHTPGFLPYPHVRPKGAWPSPKSSMYLVDPEGYLILAYPKASWQKPMIKDLKHLERNRP